MLKMAMAWLLVSGIAVTSYSCDPATAVAVPILVITNTWEVDGQEGRSFNFTALNDSDGLEEGTFEGQEEIFDPFEQHDLEGSWAHGQITFTVELLGEDDAVYTGTFEDRPNRLIVHSAQRAETITIVRSSSE